MLKTVSSFVNVIGALNYKGTWNASTNNPALASGVGTKGDYYVVSVAGNTSLDGTTLWGVGDWAVFNGTIWQKVDGGDTGNFTSIVLKGSSTGVSTISSANAGATNYTVTVPAATTIIPVATQTLTFSGPSAARTITLPDANFTVARTDAANSFTGDQTLSTGNIIQGTAAKGVDFSANTPAAGKTSTLLSWYEEGTWTPSVGGDATYNIQTGNYTRIGRQVIAFMDLHINVLGTGSTNTITGLPFTVGTNQGGVASYFSNLALNVVSLTAAATATSTSLTLLGLTEAAVTTTYAIAALGNNARIQMTITYIV